MHVMHLSQDAMALHDMDEECLMVTINSSLDLSNLSKKYIEEMGPHL